MPEWVCLVAVLLVAGLCYFAGWKGRLAWSAAACVVAVVQVSLSRSLGCLGAMIVVGALCGFAGSFDKRR